MAAQIISHARFAPRGTARPSVQRGWTALMAVLVAVLRARRTRRLLLEMDDRMLADIGIDRGEAWMEATRSPWDLQPRR